MNGISTAAKLATFSEHWQHSDLLIPLTADRFHEA